MRSVHWARERRRVEGRPDLVVEVVSPSTALRARGIKLDRYRLYGVPEYWVVDPEEQTVEVCSPATMWQSPPADRPME